MYLLEKTIFTKNNFFTVLEFCSILFTDTINFLTMNYTNIRKYIDMQRQTSWKTKVNVTVLEMIFNVT